MQHEVNIAGLTLDQASNTPILILKAVNSEHSIPIWIGLLEATSIASVLQNINFDRPMTHDLFKNFMSLVEIDVAKVEVCDLKDNTLLFISEYVSEDEFLQSYHWQTNDNKMVCRWDNSPHYKHIRTFPHHKHTSDLKESFSLSLEEVLKEVSEKINMDIHF